MRLVAKAAMLVVNCPDHVFVNHGVAVAADLPVLELR